MNLKLLILSVLWLFCTPLWAQVSCVVSNQESAPVNYPAVTAKSARQQVTRIAVLPNIVHQSNGTQIFTESDVKELIRKANEYFSPINFEFYIVNQGIRHIFNDEFYNLEFENENELRKIYDVDYAINLYFLHTIRKPNKDILNGFTSLPSLNGLSNRIMLSYLDRNRADFESLRDKIFPHELGHYFGLLHTFQDSNDEDIAKRELVTRGIGANCSTTGDYLCDTDADPYERFPSISTLGCENTLPSEFFDALGSRYTPPTNNIMSYNIRCDHVFTNQQFERMQAASSIRFSPEADYTIILQSTNDITISPLTKRLFCVGETALFKWKAHGFYAQNNSFTVELTNDGTSTIPVEAAFVANEIFIQIPQEINPAQGYRMRVLSSNPAIHSEWSEHFEIRNIGKAILSSNSSEINLGDQIQLNLEISGSGPWDVTLSDGTSLQSLRGSNISLFKKPIENTQYSISSISNECGSLEKEGVVNVSVAEPKLTINGGSNLKACEGEFIGLPVSGLQTDEEVNYRVYLKGKESFLIVPVVSNNRLYFNLPRELEFNEDILVQVKGNGLGNFSSSIYLNVLPKPRQPFIQSPVTLCYDSTNAILSAEIENGNQPKWYDQNLSLIGNQGIVNTRIPGISNYFVSQISSDGCESEKSKIEVEIKEPLQASISGDQNIFQGDSARLKLDITGEGPFEIILNDGTTLFANQSSMLYYVKPSDSFTYEIRHVRNQCGFGSASGKADVQVIVLLSNEGEKFIDEENSIFPNPSSGYFYLKGDCKVHQIVNAKGENIPFNESQGSLRLNKKGVFFITLENPDETYFTTKVLVK